MASGRAGLRLGFSYQAPDQEQRELGGAAAIC